MQFIGRAPQCCIYFYSRSVITFRGRKGLYKAAVGLQFTHYVTFFGMNRFINDT